MNAFEIFVFVSEIISSITFAISGSVTAIKKGFDLFGVIILGITTATGGGIIRDLILGINPPVTFVNPIYATIAAATALTVFALESHHYKKSSFTETIPPTRFTDRLMFWFDTLGLGIFTMVGVEVAFDKSSDYNAYLICFVGVITGVGGGLMRDIMAGNTPYIFVKHFYACACLIGSIVSVLLWYRVGKVYAMLAGTAVIILLRCLAAKFKWNFPRIQLQKLTTGE